MAKFGRLAAGFCFFLIICLSAFAEDTIHTVQSGETIYSLAQKYNAKEADILFLNGIDDARKIQVGQKLRIPGSSIMAPSPGTGAYTTHTAVKGDTLFAISRLYGISIDELRKLNNLSSGYVLKIGDKIKAPVHVAVNNQTDGTSAQAAQTGNQTAVPKVDLSIEWPVNVREAAYITGQLSGIALTAEHGESVHSISTGVVVDAGPFRGFGRVAIVQNEDAYQYVYGGCETLTVKVGDKVAPGTTLGTLGIDSVSNKPRLFFMVYRNTSPVDPAKAPRS